MVLLSVMLAAVLITCLLVLLPHSANSLAASTKKAQSHQYCSDDAQSLADYVDCVVSASLPRGYLGTDPGRYALYQPTQQQQTDFSSLIQELVSYNGGGGGKSGCSLAIPQSLQDVYAFNALQDGADAFCVLEDHLVYDQQTGQSLFSKGWPVFMTWQDAASVRHPLLHLSAPHLLFDMYAERIAAHGFQYAHAKSLLMWPRHRNSSTIPSPCVIPAGTDTRYGRTDPAHNIDNLFHTAMTTLYTGARTAQPQCFTPQSMQNSTAATACPLFVQMHGKGEGTCADTTHFVSHGAGDAAFYNNNPNLAAHLFVQGLAQANGGAWAPADPGTNSCSLKATDNVAGRVISGVQLGQECKIAANDAQNYGRFVHIEQTTPDVMHCLECWNEVWDYVLQ
ncbi:hypothetical protein RI367_002215 [Sorochytrium milnesiophthora]